MTASFVATLRAHDVTLLDASSGRAECDTCGERWYYGLPSHVEQLRPRFWLCPLGCNAAPRPERPPVPTRQRR